MEQQKTTYEKLYNLYWEANKKIYCDVQGKNKNLKENEKANYPFFIFPSDDYESAEVKIMIFGQETGRFENSEQYGDNAKPELVVEDIMELYNNDYNFNGINEKPFDIGFNTTISRGVRDFINIIRLKNQNKNVKFVWNNVIKMAMKSYGNPPTKLWYDEIIKPYLNPLILKEIEILSPDFLVFFSGPNYDKYLNDIFNKPEYIKINDFGERELCEINIPEIKKAYRTYHFGYLDRWRRQGFRQKILDAITDDLTLRINMQKVCCKQKNGA
jgi:hypothetical protein